MNLHVFFYFRFWVPQCLCTLLCIVLLTLLLCDKSGSNALGTNTHSERWYWIKRIELNQHCFVLPSLLTRLWYETHENAKEPHPEMRSSDTCHTDTHIQAHSAEIRAQHCAPLHCFECVICEFIRKISDGRRIVIFFLPLESRWKWQARLKQLTILGSGNWRANCVEKKVCSHGFACKGPHYKRISGRFI